MHWKVGAYQFPLSYPRSGSMKLSLKLVIVSFITKISWIVLPRRELETNKVQTLGR